MILDEDSSAGIDIAQDSQSNPTQTRANHGLRHLTLEKIRFF